MAMCHISACMCLCGQEGGGDVLGGGVGEERYTMVVCYIAECVCL